eukprot:447624-Hanusia_phi.AAC.1
MIDCYLHGMPFPDCPPRCDGCHPMIRSLTRPLQPIRPSDLQETCLSAQAPCCPRPYRLGSLLKK